MNNFSKQQHHGPISTKKSSPQELKRTHSKSSTSKTKSNKDVNRSKDSISQINKTKTLKNAYNKNTKIDETKTTKKLQCQYCHMVTSDEEIEKIKFSCLHKICFACVCRYFLHSDFQTFSIDGPLIARCPICKDKETHLHWKDVDKVIKTSTALRKEILKDNCTSHNKEAKEYCKDCKKWLCEECFHEFHDKVFGREHALLPTKPYLLGGCALHNNRIKEMYCLDCQKDICYFCLRNGEEHDGHRNMTLKDYKAKLKLSKKVFTYKEYEAFKSGLKDIEDKFRNAYETAYEQNQSSINKIIQHLEEIKEKYIKRKAENLRFIKNFFNAIRICYYHFYEDLNIKDPVIKILNHIRNVNKEIKDVLFVSHDYTEQLAKISNELGLINVDKMFQYEVKFEYHDLHLMKQHSGHTCQIYSITEANNGDLVTGGNDGVIRVWDGSNGKLKLELEEHKGIVFTMLFVNDKKWLVSGGEDSKVRVWDFDVINEIKKIEMTAKSRLEEEKKERMESIGSEGGKGQQQQLKKTTFLGKNSDMNGIIEEQNENDNMMDSRLKKSEPIEEEYDPDKEYDNYNNDNDNDNVKESNTNKASVNIYDQISSKLSDQGIIKSSRKDNDNEAQQQQQQHQHLQSSSLMQSIIQNKSCTVKYYDIDNPPFTFRIDPHQTLNGHNGNIYSITELEGKRLCTCAHDKLILIWSLTDFTCRHKLEGHTKAVGYVLNYSSQFLISGGVDKRMFIWEFNSENVPIAKRQLVGHSNSIFSIDKLPNGKIISGSCDHTLRLWNVHERKCEFVFNGHEGFVWKVLALNDGKVISVGSDRTLRVWDVYEKKCLSVVLAHGADITCLVLMKDGKVVSGSVDGVMKIWGL